MKGTTEKFRKVLLTLHNRIPPSLQFVQLETIQQLSQRALVVIMVLAVISPSVVAVPIMDADNDGVRNGTEWAKNVDWQAQDTDGDGLIDGREVSSPNLNATDPDTDADGLNDTEEVELGTNASSVDSDGDGIDDLAEATNGTDPTQSDTDGDSLSDLVEVTNSTSPVNADSDGDGLDDGLEFEIGSNATNRDTDHDLLPDKREWELNTSLVSWDTDGDSLSDVREATSDKLNPRKADTDSDGLNDSRELMLVTLVNVSDTDNDGLKDGPEFDHATSPIDNDTDNDSLLDGAEIHQYGSDPLNNDTDFDNVSDSIEVGNEILNVSDPDIDDDGLNDGVEWYGETNVTLADTDADGLDDWNETKVYPTDPVINDTDSDGLLDGNETLRFATEPLDPDTDGDELKDGPEKHTFGTNATNPDTDGDALIDGREVNEYGTDPLKNDTDGDGLSDAREVKYLQTSPTNADTDGDGIPDGTEVAVKGYDPVEKDPLHNKSAGLQVTASQEQALGNFIDSMVKFLHSVATNDPDAGLIMEYSQAIVELGDVNSTGPKATIVANFKQAGLYQILDLVQTNLGVGIPSSALKGRLKQAISVGARMNSVVAVVSDYATLHDQAEYVVNANKSELRAAKVGVLIATTVLVIDAYLLYQTGGTFSLASGHKLAFSATGTIAAKTGLARLAKYCGWRCVGGVERILHWSLRSLIDIGETKLIASIIEIGYFEVTGITLFDILDGLSAEYLKQIVPMLKDILSEAILQRLKEVVSQLVESEVGSWFSRDEVFTVNTPSERGVPTRAVS
ncbi:hypothetical protein C5B91_18040 [Haloferax sp. Atlit-10N]|uniref:hypothetical protein n=1 Tax=unclassified Haloferax TaxID=2625095 RepID=UPI000E231FCF|nr:MULTISPECIES: hypothetical protein [unclassified Haloferax]RDZ44450.1 hypothetical protein C5B87_09535 [Haloferax sp. Atlit-16N]RDZ56259.1 hypothetical protein C5B91_18040 [Haloferax sp. Atlit-10N]